jgi:hypothetical protein
VNWLEREIMTGFQRLVCLSLERTPAKETIAGTVRAWRDAMIERRSYDEARDAPLMREAFKRLSKNVESWPSPKKFIEHMDAVTPLPTYERLPAPTTIPRTRAERREHLRRMFPVNPILDGEPPCNE